ncbi:survival motor neuron protein-like isoform X4 [Trachinotus anak]|uniref:survival motor neuron protein-like isoform X4 n=1 Tax=Trachinotus anak TaxID=443729 RepID=UPI0039F1CE38
MSEPTEHGVLHGAAGPVEPDPAAETSLVQTFENTLEISQDVKLCAASEETNSREKLEDEQTVCLPAAETSTTESKWVVGDQCQAVWSEDGLVYPATVVSLSGERCRVCFNSYGNEEDMELSALQRLKAAPHTQRQNAQDWSPGSRCRAVYSEDGVVYPAVVLWVKGQRCRVRFDDYNNEEEQDISSLLSPDELHGPLRATTKGSSWKSTSTSHFDRRRGRREENQEERRRDQQSCSRDPLSFMPPPPPPPPLWMFGGKESRGSTGVDSTSSMLMLWYMCGFHTGSFMAQQLLRSNSKD